jgi:hypothetical protein
MVIGSMRAAMAARWSSMEKYTELSSPVACRHASRASPAAFKAASCASGKVAAKVAKDVKKPENPADSSRQVPASGISRKLGKG